MTSQPFKWTDIAAYSTRFEASGSKVMLQDPEQLDVG